jgi:hypothetical protein
MKWTLCVRCAALAAATPARSSQSQIPMKELDAGSDRSGVYSIPIAVSVHPKCKSQSRRTTIDTEQHNPYPQLHNWHSTLMPEIEYEFGGTRFVVDGWDYVSEVPFGEDGEVVCGVDSGSGGWGFGEDAVVVGTVFLRGLYTRWEFGEERRVGCEYCVICRVRGCADFGVVAELKL